MTPPGQTFGVPPATPTRILIPAGRYGGCEGGVQKYYPVYDPGIAELLPPITDTATPLTEEQILLGFCDQLDLTRCPSGCTKALCEQAVRAFLAAVRSTWICNIFGHPIGWNTCRRWANTCKSNVGNLQETNPCVTRSEVCLQRASANLGLTNIHATFQLGLYRQFTLEADNGCLGGDNHIILPPGVVTTRGVSRSQ